MKDEKQFCSTCISREDCSLDEVDQCAVRDYWLYEKEPTAMVTESTETEKYCSTCDWYETFSGICSNGNSEHCADFCDPDDICDEWYKLVIKPEEM